MDSRFMLSIAKCGSAPVTGLAAHCRRAGRRVGNALSGRIRRFRIRGSVKADVYRDDQRCEAGQCHCSLRRSLLRGRAVFTVPGAGKEVRDSGSYHGKPTPKNETWKQQAVSRPITLPTPDRNPGGDRQGQEHDVHDNPYALDDRDSLPKFHLIEDLHIECLTLRFCGGPSSGPSALQPIVRPPSLTHVA